MSRIRKEVDINNIIKRQCLNFEEHQCMENTCEYPRYIKGIYINDNGVRKST